MPFIHAPSLGSIVYFNGTVPGRIFRPYLICYCEITFIRGVPVFVGRLIHEIKNPTNNETWEAVWHRYIAMMWCGCTPKCRNYVLYIYPEVPARDCYIIEKIYIFIYFYFIWYNVYKWIYVSELQIIFKSHKKTKRKHEKVISQLYKVNTEQNINNILLINMTQSCQIKHFTCILHLLNALVLSSMLIHVLAHFQQITCSQIYFRLSSYLRKPLLRRSIAFICNIDHDWMIYRKHCTHYAYILLCKQTFQIRSVLVRW
jgi:hypothetical protein